MCDGGGDIEDLKPFSQESVKNISKGAVSKCKKCEKRPILLLQKKDPFCRECFFEYCNHKFRSTIGKTKKVKHGDKVLLACSGGRKSTAMLHMTKKALDSASAKQISFVPGILYIEDSVLLPFLKEPTKFKNADVIENLKSYGYPVFVSTLEMVCKLNDSQDFYWTCDDSDSSTKCHEAQNWFQDCMKDMTLSEKCDLVKHMRLLLMTEIANHIGYDYIFVGDSGNSLTVDLLSDISLGRGSQISYDTGFLDARFKIPICRPIREFLNKELLLYLHLHNCPYYVIPDLLSKTESTSCVQRLTECFINDLQENFPATIFTIFRTGGKLSIDNSVLSNKNCIICKSKLDNVNPDACSAIEALKVSENLSISPSDSEIQNLSISSNESSDFENSSVKLCHSCSVQFRKKVSEKELLNFLSGASGKQIEKDVHAISERNGDAT